MARKWSRPPVVAHTERAVLPPATERRHGGPVAHACVKGTEVELQGGGAALQWAAARLVSTPNLRDRATEEICGEIESHRELMCPTTSTVRHLPWQSCGTGVALTPSAHRRR